MVVPVVVVAVEERKKKKKTAAAAANDPNSLQFTIVPAPTPTAAPSSAVLRSAAGARRRLLWVAFRPEGGERKKRRRTEGTMATGDRKLAVDAATRREQSRRRCSCSAAPIARGQGLRPRPSRRPRSLGQQGPQGREDVAPGPRRQVWPRHGAGRQHDRARFREAAGRA